MFALDRDPRGDDTSAMIRLRFCPSRTSSCFVAGREETHSTPAPAAHRSSGGGATLAVERLALEIGDNHSRFDALVVEPVMQSDVPVGAPQKADVAVRDTDR